VIALFSLNFTAGHCRFGINGHGSQFMSTQKLCNRRRKTFVDTVSANAENPTRQSNASKPCRAFFKMMFNVLTNHQNCLNVPSFPVPARLPLIKPDRRLSFVSAFLQILVSVNSPLSRHRIVSPSCLETSPPLLPQKTKTTLRSSDGQVNDHREDESDQNYCNDIFVFIFDLQLIFSVSSISNGGRFIAEIEWFQRRALHATSLEKGGPGVQDGIVRQPLIHSMDSANFHGAPHSQKNFTRRGFARRF
jgi:hypothetical protein